MSHAIEIPIQQFIGMQSAVSWAAEVAEQESS